MNMNRPGSVASALFMQSASDALSVTNVAANFAGADAAGGLAQQRMRTSIGGSGGSSIALRRRGHSVSSVLPTSLEELSETVENRCENGLSHGFLIPIIVELCVKCLFLEYNF